MQANPASVSLSEALFFTGLFLKWKKNPPKTGGKQEIRQWTTLPLN